MGLSMCMQEAIELLKKKSFIYGKHLSDQHGGLITCRKTIKTNTMKALERRGIVKMEIESGRNISRVAKLMMADYEELSVSDYCIRCPQSYQNRNGRYRCRKTGNIVVGMDGRATVNGMKCH